jgi:hypothetical protein
MASEGFSKRMLKMRNDFIQFLSSEYSTVTIFLTRHNTEPRGAPDISSLASQRFAGSSKMITLHL